DLGATFEGPGGRPVTLAIASLRFSHAGDGTMSIEGAFTLDGKEGEIDLSAETGGGNVRTIEGAVRGIPLGNFFLSHTAAGAVHAGLATTAEIAVHARREAAGAAPQLALDVKLAAGAIYGDGVAAELHPSSVKATYNFDKGTIELASSDASVGQSHFPFTGGLIDLDRVSDKRDPGFAIDLVFSNAISRPVDSNEAPIRFDAKVSGYYLPKVKRLAF